MDTMMAGVISLLAMVLVAGALCCLWSIFGMGTLVVVPVLILVCGWAARD